MRLHLLSSAGKLLNPLPAETARGHCFRTLPLFTLELFICPFVPLSFSVLAGSTVQPNPSQPPSLPFHIIPGITYHYDVVQHVVQFLDRISSYLCPPANIRDRVPVRRNDLKILRGNWSSCRSKCHLRYSFRNRLAHELSALAG